MRRVAMWVTTHTQGSRVAARFFVVTAAAILTAGVLGEMLGRPWITPLIAISSINCIVFGMLYLHRTRAPR